MLLFLGIILRAAFFPHEASFDEYLRLRAAGSEWGEMGKQSVVLLGGNVAYPATLKLFGIGDPSSTRAAVPALLAFLAGLLAARAVLVDWFGKRAALFALALLSLSPFQAVHGAELKEYSILLPVGVAATWLGWRVIAEPVPRAWAWFGLAVAESLTVLLTMTGVFFSFGLGLAQVLTRGFRDFPWRPWALTHAAPLLAAVWTVSGWAKGYGRAVDLYGDSISNNLLKWSADIVYGVHFWLWAPPASTWGRLDSKRIAWGFATERDLLTFLLHGLPWLLGAPILFLCLRGIVKGPAVGRKAGVTAWCAWLVLLPVAGYGVFFALRGHPHLFPPRAFMLSSMAFYALLAVGVMSLRKRYAVAVISGSAAMLLVSIVLYLNGRHLDRMPPLGAVLSRWAGEVEPGARIRVYPSEMYPYLRFVAPAVLRDRLAPTTVDPETTPGGWATTLFDPGLIEDRTAWARAESRWLAVVPWALHWKDPELKTVQNGPVAWELVHSQINLNLYRRKD